MCSVYRYKKLTIYWACHLSQTCLKASLVALESQIRHTDESSINSNKNYRFKLPFIFIKQTTVGIFSKKESNPSKSIIQSLLPTKDRLEKKYTFTGKGGYSPVDPITIWSVGKLIR